MSKTKSTLTVFGPGMVLGTILGIYAFSAVDNSSIAYSIQMSIIGGVLGTIIGFVYWLVSRDGGEKATEKHERYVSKNSFNITQDNEVLLLDYKSISKSKAKLLPAIVTILMIGGCVPTIKNDAIGFYFAYCAVLLVFLYFGLKPTFATLKIEPSKSVEGENGRIGFEHISNFSYNTNNEVYAVSKGAEFLITSRLATSTLAMEICSELNSNLEKYKKSPKKPY